jgi:NAD(P)-dependent dehydrogenase (short-subunit alcohol dehydrogenase family)
MLFDLSGRQALVTGAGRGVAAGIAAALAGQGASVAVAVAVTVADLDSVRTAVAQVAPVDILVNNAGIPEGAMTLTPFRHLDPAAWEAAVDVNLYGVMRCCHAVVDGMCERGWGRIVTISSGAGTRGVDIGVSPYSAGKGGGIAFTRTLALEVARSGVTANTVALGLIGTADAAVNQRLSRSIPVGRTGTPADVAAACVWLVSEEAAWVTGQTIEVNGGALTT